MADPGTNIADLAPFAGTLTGAELLPMANAAGTFAVTPDQLATTPAIASLIANGLATALTPATLGTIIPASGSRDDVAAAFNLAQTNAMTLGGPMKVLIPHVGVHLWPRGTVNIGTAAARVPGIVVEIGPGVIIMKDVANWSTDNALMQFGYYDDVFITGQGILDGGQTVVPGTIVALNGTGSDLVRLFSCSRVVVQGLRWRNAADSWLRVTPFSSDPNPELSRYTIVDRVHVTSCNQFSETNSSGQQPTPRETYIMRSYFRAGNSTKLAGRGFGGKGIWHLNNVYDDYLTGLEIDGPSDIISTGNKYNNCRTAISVISNNIFAAVDYEANNLIIDDHGYNCRTGVVFKPDLQTDTLLYTWKNADIRFRAEAFTVDDGYGIDLDGDFINLKARLVSADWTRGTPIRANFRGSGKRTNAHLIIEGSYDFTGGTSKDLFVIQSDNLRAGRYAADGVKLEARGVQATGANRLATFTGMVRGTAAGATTDAAGYAAGATAINLAASGTGAIVAGDVISFAGDPLVYTVATGDYSVANGGSIVLAAPGLIKALPASRMAITVMAKGGNAAGATTDAASYAVGATTITLAPAGIGRILDGDAVRFAGDPNVYVVAKGLADISRGGAIVLAAPGLRTGMAAGAKAVTLLPKRFIRNLELAGDVSGGFAALLYFDASEQIENVFANGFRYLGDTGAGLYLQHCLGGALNACHVDAPMSPIRIGASCGGVRLGTNWAFTRGVPTAVLDEQGPVMASAIRTGTTVDVTIAHGIHGADIVVPATARRAFEFIKTDGTKIAIDSVARQSATVLRFILASDPGAIGTATGAATDSTGYAAGATTIKLASAGTGMILAGDRIQFAGDPHIYVVAVGNTDVARGGSIVLAAPGLRTAIPAASRAITTLRHTLVCHDRGVFNFLNGAAFSDPADRPYDNSGYASPLQAGALAVAEAATPSSLRGSPIGLLLSLTHSS